ncbi:MAG: 1-aminocyclopropane-carboxylate deaminase [Frankiales bacterium]|jgi:D-cysteine desulfhydrase|nr:1-aminocyclopropane-carboxylate deaminase [Frankiales bacterium]
MELTGRVPLAVLPTPLQESLQLRKALGVSDTLLVKRDDLTGFAFAGNKARQLELLLGELKETGADVLVTGGTLGSNFVQAAAAAAAYAGVRCVLVLAGPERPGTAHPSLAAALAWGAEPRWTGTDDRSDIDVLLPEVAADLAAGGARPYVAPPDGASATGALGYRLAVDELVSQLGGLLPLVLVPTGAGGTQAGLVAGVVAHGRGIRVVGASVSRPADEVAARVLELSREVAARRGEELPVAADVEVVDARGPGHGLASEAGNRAADVALRTAGLVLDPVYTAKALATLPALAGDRPNVFWHTGGLLDAVAALLAERR